MLKRLLTGAALVPLLAACATESPGLAAQLAARASRPMPGCVPDVATRIPVKADECGAFGRSYSRDDLQGTGSADPAGALRLLDPAMSFGGR